MAPPDESDLARQFAIGPGAKLNINTDAAKASVDAMAASIAGLQKALNDFGNNAYNMAEKINRHLKSIGETANTVTNQLNGLTTAVSSAGGGGGGGGAPPPPNSTAPASASGSSSWVSSAAASINSAIQKPRVGSLSLGTFLGDSDDTAKDLVMAPLRFLRDRINTNRETAIQSSGALSMVSRQQFEQGGTASMMKTLGRFPGNIYGSRDDLLGMFAQAPSLGASYNFGAQAGNNKTGGQGVRAAGFFKGVQEMQMLNPMANVGGEGGLVSTLGGYAADTGAQQRSMMLTGGAMGMIGGGGRQKSLSEWAESILRWFEGLRPGANRGKAFNYGDLMAQYFPGSNIDAWFNVNGVPPNMRDYWWTYALGKATKSDSTQGKYEIGTDPENVAWQRLRAGSELTRTEFGLAGNMAGQYANREGSNRWFNELLGQVMQKIIPLLSKGPLGMIQFLPDSIEDLLMTGTERGMTELLGGGGDIGDAYGDMGGTGLSGLHPDMKSKVGAMMRANPRLRMTSSLRDTGLQERLKAKGHSRVSGKPSAHTRGMAADLGPKSEYGWISRNAKRFGLASGKGHGEPWHVGMQGDIPGMGDVGIGDFELQDFFDAIGRGDNSMEEGMANIISTLLGWMTKGIGKITGSSTPDEVKADPDALYKRLAGYSQTKLGKMTKVWDEGGGGGGSDSNGFVRNPTTLPGGGGGASDAGIAAATALFNAGFNTRKDLETITAISWRESKWSSDPQPRNATDRGLMQINKVAHKDTMQAMGYTEADLLNPQKNANIAYRLWKDGGGDYASFQQLWGFSEHSRFQPHNGPGWDSGGDPLGRTQGSNAPAVVEAANLPGLGDIEAMRAQSTLPVHGAGVNFNNTFNLSVPTYGGGSAGGIDVRQTVTLIADHLEKEMNRRMKRSA